MTTGQHIQAARKAAGLTQRQLGELLNVSGSMIGQYENDLRNPKPETLGHIASVLNVDVSQLIPEHDGTLITATHLLANKGTKRTTSMLEKSDVDTQIEVRALMLLSEYTTVYTSQVWQKIRNNVIDDIKQHHGNGPITDETVRRAICYCIARKLGIEIQ